MMRRAVFARLCLLLVLVLLSTALAFGQGSKIRVNDKEELETEEQDNPLAREAWFRKGRISPDGRPVAAWLNQAYAQKMQLRANFANRLRSMQINGTSLTPNATIPVGSGTTVWSPMGPGPMNDDNLVGQNYGPNVGRINAVAVNPTDNTGNQVVIGAAYGGVWITNNAAASDPTKVYWTAAFDQQATLAIGSLSWKPDGSVILAGSGEGNAAIDSYYGLGIFRFNGATQTWSQITSSADGHSFMGLGFQRQAWSNTSPNVVAISATVASRNEGAFAGSSRQGLYYSTDSGITWQLAQFFDAGTLVSVTASSNSVVWNPVNHKFYAHLRAHGIYVSRNADDPSVFDRLGAQPDLPNTTPGSINITGPSNCSPTSSTLANCPIYRAELAAHPTRNELYVWWIDGGINSKGIWKSLDGGTTWTQLTDTGFITCGDGSGCGATQAFYNMTVLAVSNPTTTAQTDLYIGSVNQYKCTIDNAASNGNEKCANTTVDSPFSFKNLTHVYGCATGGDIAHVHPDQHSMSAVLGTGIIYFAHDGGISRTLNSANVNTGVCGNSNAYDNLNYNMGALTQYVWGTAIPNDAKGMIAGSQDNGSATVFTGLTPTNGQTWVQINGGDGGYNDIDTASPSTWYSANTHVSVQKSTAGTATNRNSWGIADLIKSTDVGGDSSAFYTPYMLDPQLTSKILIGTCRIFRGPNTPWVTTPGAAISPMLTSTGTCGANDANVTAIATGSATGTGGVSKVIWAALDDGTVKMTADSGIASPVWTNATPLLTQNPGPSWGSVAPGWPVSSIAVDQTIVAGTTAYISVQGFHVGHVFKTTNGGTSWTDISTGLPDAPANNVIIDPDDHNVLYVGTDVGVFSLDQSVASPSWVEVGPVSSSGSAGYIPNVPVYRLIRQDLSSGTVKILKAVTYGRGVWVAYITNGTPTLTFSPASPIAFGTVAVGASSSQTITFTNTGTAAVTVVSPSPLSDGTNWELDSISCGNLPVSVEPGGTCQLNITFHPTVAGPLSATLTLNDNAGGHVITFNGTGQTAGASFGANPNPVAFPSTPINTSSATINVTISNGGGLALNITAITPLNMTTFQRQSGNCPTAAPASINAGASCTDVYLFHPTVAGAQAGSITYTTNAPNSPNVINFTGTGTAAPAVQLSAPTLAFGNQNTGTTSANQTETITNTGTANLVIGTVTIAGQYNKASDTCSGQTVTPTNTCTIQVNFAPTATGAQNGTLTIPSNATPSSNTVNLTGTGTTPGVQIAPASLAFGNVMIGTPSTTQNFTLTNNGTGPLTITSISFTGTNPTSFGQTNTCPISPATLAAGANCTITVTFTPQAVGALAATVSVADSAAGSPHTAGVSGTGTGSTYTATPNPLAFGTVAIGGPSSLLETIHNTGTGTMTFSAATAAPYSVNGSGSCTASIAAGASCTVGVTYTPTAPAGPQNGTLTFTTNGVGPASVSLTGTSTNGAISANPSSVTFSAQLVGTTSGLTPITITNVTTNSVTVNTLTIGGTNSSDFLKDAGCASAILATQNATCTVNVSFKPSATGNRTGTLTLSNTGGPDLVINLSGTGAVPTIGLAPAGPIDFGSVNVGSTSAPTNVTLTNNGGVDLHVSAIATAAPFAVSLNTCAPLNKTLAPNASCIVQVTFTPTAPGTAPSTNLTITDDSGGTAGAVQNIGLTGTGTQPTATLSTNNLAFGSLNTGKTSTAQTVTVTNNGNGPLNVNTVTISGQFVISSDTCSGKAVAAGGGNCAIGVQFKPTTTGPQAGTLTIPDNAPGSPQTVSLAGTGTAPGVTLTPPAPLNFSNQVVGTTSTGQNITVTNSGTGPLTVSGVTITGTNAGDFSQTNTCTAAAVPASTNCAITVTFTPNATGARTATINIADDAAGSPQTYVVNGTGTGPSIELDISGVLASTLAFGNQRKGVLSAERQFQVKNTGTADLHVTATPLSGANAPDFSVTTNSCPAALAAGLTCNIGVKFNPGATGARTAAVSITGDALSGNSTMNLTGTGIFPVVTTNPPTNALDFATVKVNTTSATQTFTLTNSGTDTLNITGSVVTAAAYNVTNNCGVGTVAAGANCTIVVAFAPTATGAAAGTVVITHDLGTTTLNLTGTGALAQGTPNPTSLTFTFQKVGTTSTAQNITFTNTGSVQMANIAVAKGGASPTQYGLTTTCGTTLAPNANCSASVTFSPTAAGTPAATVTFTHDGSNSPNVVNVTGTGEVPAVTPNPTVAAGVAFNGKPVTTSSTATVTLTNTSHVALAINSVAAAGTGFTQTNTCGASVAGQGNCVITVTFNPTTTGVKNGTLTVTTDAAAPSNNMVFNLTGTGEDFTQSVAAPGSATVTAGNSATFTMTETPAGGNFTNAIQFSCTGLDSTMGCSFNPTQVTPGSAAQITTVTITTKKGSGTAPALSGSAQHRNGGTPLLAFLLALPGMAVFFPTIGNRKLSWQKKLGLLMLLLVVLMMVLSMAGCSNGGTPGTKVGTYNIGIVAASGSLAHTTNVTVTVQ